MIKPSTVAAVAILACVPALISFVSGNLSAVGLGIRYLVALVMIGIAAHFLSHLWHTYSHQSHQPGDQHRGRHAR